MKIKTPIVFRIDLVAQNVASESLRSKFEKEVAECSLVKISC